MKIEIEFEEVEFLKKRVANLEIQLNDAKQELKSLDSEELKREAGRLARKMFEDYMRGTFEKLGFDIGSEWASHVDFNNIEHWLGKSWSSSEKLSVTLSAHLNNHFRTAFLQFGVKTNEE